MCRPGSRQGDPVSHTFRLRFKTVGAFVDKLAREVPSGELFVPSRRLPRLNERIALSFSVANAGGEIELTGRVARHQSGQKSGFFLELDLDAEQRERLASIIGQHQCQARGDDDGAAERWLILMGMTADVVRRNVDYLKRPDLSIAEVRDVEEVRRFAASHNVTSMIVDGSAADIRQAATAIKKINPTAVVIALARPSEALPPCEGVDEVVDLPIVGSRLPAAIAKHVDVRPRRSPRVQYAESVEIGHASSRHPGEIVNLSCGGALIRSQLKVRPVSLLNLRFLLEGREVSTKAIVLRRDSDAESGHYLYGVAFVDLAPSHDTLLRRFVEKNSHFGEYFDWMKEAYFETTDPQ